MSLAERSKPALAEDPPASVERESTPGLDPVWEIDETEETEEERELMAKARASGPAVPHDVVMAELHKRCPAGN